MTLSGAASITNGSMPISNKPIRPSRHEVHRKHAIVIADELLPYFRYGESKYGVLGRLYELQDFQSPSPESLARLRAIIDEAFGRNSQAAQGM